MANVDEILNKLNNVITSGNESGGNVLNVGILNDNALRKLSEAIRSGIKKNQDNNNNKKESDRRADRQNNRAMVNDAMSNYVEKGFKNLGNIVTDTGEKIRTSLQSWMRYFPLLSDAFIFTKDLSLKLFDMYQGSYLNIYELHKVGQNLNSGVSSIYEAAGQIGISSEKLIETITGNSEVVSQLTGIMKSSDLNPMYDYLKMAKKMAKEIGLSFDMTVNMSKDAYRDFAEHLSLTQGNMDILNSKTETYIMFLEKLSKVTGKSAESIAKETEARDKEISWRVLSMDPKNKMKIATMSGLGMSIDEQISVLTGVPNETSTLGSLTPGYAHITEYMRNYQGNDPEEFLKGLKEISGNYTPLLGSQISFLQKNPQLAFALQEQMKGLNLMFNVNEMSVERMIEQAGLNETLEAMANIEEKWNLFKQKWNAFIMSFSPLFETTIQFFSDTLDGILNLFDDGKDTKEEDKTKKIEEGIKKFNETYKEFLNNLSNSIIGYGEKIKGLFESGEWKEPDKLWNTIFKPIGDIIIDNLKRMGNYILENLKNDFVNFWSDENKNGKPTEDRGIGDNVNPVTNKSEYLWAMGMYGISPRYRMVNATRAWNMVDDYGDGDYADAAEQAFKITGSMGATKKMDEFVLKQIGKTSAGKAIGKIAGKSIIKKIPFIGAIAGLGFGAKRLWDTWDNEGGADWTGAGLEIASGTASTVPGLGTVVSAGIDAGLAYKDSMKEYETYNKNMSEQMKTKNESIQKQEEIYNENTKDIKDKLQYTNEYLGKMCKCLEESNKCLKESNKNTNGILFTNKMKNMEIPEINQ